MIDMVIPRNHLKKLYHMGMSMTQIAKELECSLHKITYWMDKYQIKRRTRSEANYLFHNPHGDPFNLNNLPNLTSSEMFLYGLGLGIYWGEGNKTSTNAVRVSNTDPNLIINFRRFLVEICRFDESRIRYSLICFNDTLSANVKQYWSKALKISPSKFGKITQIPTQGKGIYKRKSVYGVCIIHAGNTKLKSWIISELDRIKKMPG